MKPGLRDVSQIELYLEYGIDLHHRRIYFGDIDYDEGSDVGFSSIEMAIRSIDKMLDLNNKPIELHMNSFGGSAYDMLALYDKIRESPCKFLFYGRGAIMSAATFIMCICDERYLSEHTTVMVHEGWTETYGNCTDVKIDQEESDRLNRKLYEIYSKNSKMTDPKFWERVCQRDLYMEADEAVELGLADKIIEPRKRGNFRRGVRAQTFSNISRKDISKAVDKLYKRIKVSVPRNLVIEVKKEECEDIRPYDKSEEEMERMGIKKEVKVENDGQSGSNGE
jgi:ATP-dependent protease ClpP protease subunit